MGIIFNAASFLEPPLQIYRDDGVLLKQPSNVKELLVSLETPYRPSGLRPSPAPIPAPSQESSGPPITSSCIRCMPSSSLRYPERFTLGSHDLKLEPSDFNKQLELSANFSYIDPKHAISDNSSIAAPSNPQMVIKLLSSMTTDDISTFPLKEVPTNELLIVFNGLSVKDLFRTLDNIPADDLITIFSKLPQDKSQAILNRLPSGQSQEILVRLKENLLNN